MIFFYCLSQGCNQITLIHKSLPYVAFEPCLFTCSMINVLSFSHSEVLVGQCIRSGTASVHIKCYSALYVVVRTIFSKTQVLVVLCNNCIAISFVFFPQALLFRWNTYRKTVQTSCFPQAMSSNSLSLGFKDLFETNVIRKGPEHLNMRAVQQ